MKKSIVAIVTVIIVFILPNFVLASWWNPGTWLEPRIEYVEKVVEKPVEVVKEVPVEVIKEIPTDNSALKAKIAQLEKDLAIAKSKIVTCPVTPAPTPEKTVVQDSTTRINQIRGKIAELELVEFQFDNLKLKEDILNILNTTKDLEGKMMFPYQKFETGVIRGSGNPILTSLPNRTQLFNIIEGYIKILKVELAKLGGSVDIEVY